MTDKTREEGVFLNDGPLTIKKLSVPEAIAIIVGVNVGSGCLALPFAAKDSGWPILLMWLFICMVFSCISMLYVAETMLRTKTPMQLSNLTEKYVGKIGSVFMFLAVIINSIGCLVAYLNGSGDILGEFFGISSRTSMIIFIVPSVLVIWFGLKVTGVAQKIIVACMVVILLVLVIASLLSQHADVSSAMFANWKYAIPGFNVAIFCYIAQYMVPEIARGLSHAPKKIAPTIVTAQVICFIMHSLLALAVMALLGTDSVSQVATIAWGKALGSWAFFIANIFALAAMITSFWSIGGSFLTNVVEKLKFKSETDPKSRFIALCLVVLPPFLLAFFGIVDFINAIYIVGSFSGVIMSILPVLMIRKARKTGEREPEFKCGKIISNPVTQGLIIAIFCCAAVYALIDLIA